MFYVKCVWRIDKPKRHSFKYSCSLHQFPTGQQVTLITVFKKMIENNWWLKSNKTGNQTITVLMGPIYDRHQTTVTWYRTSLLITINLFPFTKRAFNAIYFRMMRASNKSVRSYRDPVNPAAFPFQPGRSHQCKRPISTPRFLPHPAIQPQADPIFPIA